FRCATYRVLAARCACKQQPKPGPKPGPGPNPGPTPVGELRIVSFTGTPAGGTPGQDVTLEQHGELTLAWEVRGAEAVDLVRLEGTLRVVLVERAPLTGSHVLEPGEPTQLYVLEASAGDVLELAEVRASTTAP